MEGQKEVEITNAEVTDSSNRVKNGEGCYGIKADCAGAVEFDLVWELDEHGYLINEYFCRSKGKVISVEAWVDIEVPRKIISNHKDSTFLIWDNLKKQQ